MVVDQGRGRYQSTPRAGGREEGREGGRVREEDDGGGVIQLKAWRDLGGLGREGGRKGGREGRREGGREEGREGGRGGGREGGHML